MSRLTLNIEARVIAKAHDQAVTVRFPAGLLDRIDEAAVRRGRSRNSDVVMRLIKSLDADDLAEKSGMGCQSDIQDLTG